MKMDTTNIDDSINTNEITCITYSDNKLSIYTESAPMQPPVLNEFHRLGNSWIQSKSITNESPQGNDICYTIEEISDFNSPYQFMDPILHTLAITSAILVFFIAYSLIIKPFVRRV